MSNEVTFNESYTLHEQKLKIIELNIRNLKNVGFARFEKNMREMDQNRHKQCQLNEPYKKNALIY